MFKYYNLFKKVPENSILVLSTKIVSFETINNNF